jgi:molybdate transport system substrate-binding protein
MTVAAWSRSTWTLTAALFVLLTDSLSLSGSPSEVRIFAAASLTDALSEVATLFETSHPGTRVVPQFGGSSDLARQILAGAPADLFFSADESQMDRIASAGLVDDASRRDLLSNQLVIVEPRTARQPVRSPEDLRRVAHVAMADPEAVPAGVYARRYLEKRGIWNELQRKVGPTLDVRGALAAVASGNVEAGFVYRTDASIDSRVRIAYEVPRDEGPRILYPVALMRQRESETAAALLRYLATASAGRVFEKYGFVFLPDGR